MNYEDTVFDDGTEPTVRKVPLGCDQQGRYPEAAEAATDIGQNEDLTSFDWAAFVIIGIVVAATVVIGTLPLWGVSK
jgi:hypothetical protein